MNMTDNDDIEDIEEDDEDVAPVRCWICKKNNLTTYACVDCLWMQNIARQKAEERELYSENTGTEPIEETISIKAVLTPKRIKEELDLYVIGQDDTKKMLSVALYNHYKRVNNRKLYPDLQKSNILIMGPTGCGKTHLMRTAAKFLRVPFVEGDASSLSHRHWAGTKVHEIVSQLKDVAVDIDDASIGIVYFDEIDKMISSPVALDTNHNVHGGSQVQHELLKVLDGSNASAQIPFATHDVLFVFSGAFEGLETIIDKRLNSQIGSMGFSGTVSVKKKPSVSLLKQATVEDFIAYGFIPEFIGRIPVRLSIDQLTEKDLIQILTTAKGSALEYYTIMFAIDDVELVFEQEALWTIATQAIKQNTGARGLKAIVEPLLVDIMFEAPSLERLKTVRITKEVVEGKITPILEYHKAKDNISEDEEEIIEEVAERITEECKQQWLAKE